jgi:hypothetical protein
VNRNFALLYRHFFKEYFYIETASGHRENSLSVGHIFAFLFVPGIFLAGFSLMKTGPLLDKPPADHVISGLDDRLVFIVFAMVVASLASMLNLHKLLPSRRSIDTLSTLPISVAVLVMARTCAYLSFVLLICADAAIVSCFIYPLSLAPWDSSFSVVVGIFFAHVLTIALCTLFTIATVSAIYAICRYIIPSAISLFNLIAVAISIAYLLVGPLGLRLLVNWPKLARANPALWFLGFYEVRLPRISPDVEFHGTRIIFNFAALSHRASLATAIAILAECAVVAFVCYLTESGSLVDGRKTFALRGRVLASAMRLVPSGIPRAAAMLYWSALYRVPECRLALAIFFGTAFGVITNEVLSSNMGSRWLFIAPFVLTFFVTIGMAAVSRLPVHLEARWFLQLSPGLKAREVRRGIASSIATFGLVPLLLVLVVPYRNLMGLSNAVTLLSFACLAAFILLEIVTWNISSFPFSFERTTPQQALPFIFVCFCLALMLYGLLLGVVAESLMHTHTLMYANVALFAVWIAVRLTQRRLNTAENVSFTEVDEDQVQVLNLS